MPHLEGLTNLGAALNLPYMGDWPHRIGQFVIKFGAIEWLTYQFLNTLEATRSEYEKNLDRLFSARIERYWSSLTLRRRIRRRTRVKSRTYGERRRGSVFGAIELPTIQCCRHGRRVVVAILIMT